MKDTINAADLKTVFFAINCKTSHPLCVTLKAVRFSSLNSVTCSTGNLVSFFGDARSFVLRTVCCLSRWRVPESIPGLWV